MYGDGMEDWKKKYLQSSNQLQQARHDAQELRSQVHKQKKVLMKELGSEEAVEKALALAEDPTAAGLKGRAAQITQLQRQVRDLREQLKKAGPSTDDIEYEASESNSPAGYSKPGRSLVANHASEKEQRSLQQAAEKRREELQQLQEEVDRLRGENADHKKKRDALKSRASVLEGQLRELKAHVQTLIQKSNNDDELVSAMQRQLGRHGPMPEGGASDSAEEAAVLREENAELQAQLDRQAQIVLQLRQKNLEAKVESGSARLGPKSVEAGTSERALVERIRYLEADNTKQAEQVRLLRSQLGEDSLDGRPASAESSLNLKEKLRHLNDKVAGLERENIRLREGVDDQRPSSRTSCGSARDASVGSGSRHSRDQGETACGRPPSGNSRESAGGARDREGSYGPGSGAGKRDRLDFGPGSGPGTDQLLRQNEVMKRQIARMSVKS
eukprot:gnl/TRDRNA2_/TRDRNA2_35114_c0_seq1.p1 gnl/TRDRNA2_/TRDRNA2_35114_c0~~gnl/TRDRNA2_/TRDRNA2_35114_c0_seq1.p1  ORF type:complete len:515 (+),score=142.50 gnl/TRDRNA2_/TRDRNA2_35114_c0_seq1:215-1546(+)